MSLGHISLRFEVPSRIDSGEIAAFTLHPRGTKPIKNVTRNDHCLNRIRSRCYFFRTLGAPKNVWFEPFLSFKPNCFSKQVSNFVEIHMLFVFRFRTTKISLQCLFRYFDFPCNINSCLSINFSFLVRLP